MILTLMICFILPGTEPDPEPEVRMTGHLEYKYHEASPQISYLCCPSFLHYTQRCNRSNELESSASFILISILILINLTNSIPNFWIPNLKPSKKNGKHLKPRSFETKTSHSVQCSWLVGDIIFQKWLDVFAVVL